MNKNDQFWFKAKKYGVGWGLPVSWQGWLILLAYFLLIGIGVGVLFLTKNVFFIPLFIIYIMLLSGILIWICWKKGEKTDK